MRIEQEPQVASQRGAQAADIAAATRLLEMIGASWMSQAICVAAELELADRLANGPRTLPELADATHCAPESLLRLLRALASLGLCVQQDNQSFALTPVGALLRKDAAFTVRAWAIWWGRYLWPLWENLHYSVAHGASARELATGRKGYAHLDADSNAAVVFNLGMLELSRIVATALLSAYDFSTASRVVDVGGGYGEVVRAILQSHPVMRGVLFDLPHAVNGAKAQIADPDVASRLEFVEGSFFESIPMDGDLYLLKSILHNWPDERVAVILGNCRAAMSHRAKLLLIERVMPERMHECTQQQALSRTDLNMLVGLGGRERTAAEITTLLDDSGFETGMFLALTPEFTLIEATPAQ